jgi:hypothetical protein
VYKVSQQEVEWLHMSDAQFYLMTDIPTFAVLIGIVTNTIMVNAIHASFDRLEAKLDAAIAKSSTTA